MLPTSGCFSGLLKKRENKGVRKDLITWTSFTIIFHCPSPTGSLGKKDYFSFISLLQVPSLMLGFWRCLENTAPVQGILCVFCPPTLPPRPQMWLLPKWCRVMQVEIGRACHSGIWVCCYFALCFRVREINFLGLSFHIDKVMYLKFYEELFTWFIFKCYGLSYSWNF